MSNEELEKKSHFITNAAYMTAMALDLLIRESEKCLNKMTPAAGWKFDKKQNFTRYTDYVKKACLLNDKLTQDIYDVEKKNDYRYVQVWQEEANELARFILLISDRTSDVDVVNKIYDFIKNQPSDGFATEDLLKRFYLKE